MSLHLDSRILISKNLNLGFSEIKNENANCQNTQAALLYSRERKLMNAYGIFQQLAVRGRDVSLVRGGQNSLWVNGSLCLIGNAHGMCLGGGGVSL